MWNFFFCLCYFFWDIFIFVVAVFTTTFLLYVDKFAFTEFLCYISRISQMVAMSTFSRSVIYSITPHSIRFLLPATSLWGYLLYFHLLANYLLLMTHFCKMSRGFCHWETRWKHSYTLLLSLYVN